MNSNILAFRNKNSIPSRGCLCPVDRVVHFFVPLAMYFFRFAGD